LNATTQPATESPARDGRVFVETPAEVEEAAKAYLAADLAWKAGLSRDNLPFAERTRLYEEAMETERALVRAMEAAQGPWARLAGYYEVGGRIWVGFDKVSPDGLTLVVKRTRPVFAARRPR
jgi:hypothetical protein